MFQGKRLLFLSAHMDDYEFGCGASVARFAKNNTCAFFALSSNRKSFAGEVQEVRDHEESIEALAALGLERPDLRIGNKVPGQLFPEHRQLVLEELYRIKADFKPDIIFTTGSHDIHQDHRTLHLSVLKAFKRESVLAYEVVNSTQGFQPNLFIQVEEEDVMKKAQAIACYKSQYNGVNTTSDYFSQEIIFSLARSRGARAGFAFAEAFEVSNFFIP